MAMCAGRPVTFSRASRIMTSSITGAKIMSKNIEGNTLKAELNKGIYVVKIHRNNQISTSKIIVK